MTQAQNRLETVRSTILRLAPVVEVASLLALGAVIVLALCFPASAAGATGIEKKLDVAAGRPPRDRIRGRLDRDLEPRGRRRPRRHHPRDRRRRGDPRGLPGRHHAERQRGARRARAAAAVAVLRLQVPQPRDRGRGAPPLRRRRGDVRRRGVGRGPRRQGRCADLGRLDLARRDQRSGDGHHLRRQHPAAVERR